MAVHAISYDLHDPGQDYSDLHDAIESIGDSCHVLESTWLVESSKSPSEIRDELKSHIDSNDRLLVVKKCETGSTWATTFSSDCTDWLHDH